MNDDSRFKPSGECFTLSLDFIEACVNNAIKKLERTMNSNDVLSFPYILVHGICRTPTGRRYSHAWVEDKSRAYFAVIDKQDYSKAYLSCDKFKYHELVGVETCTSYNVKEAYFLNAKYGNYGPWEIDYLKLCRNYIEGAEKEHLRIKRSDFTTLSYLFG